MNTDELKLYTIGFTGKSAEEFFTILKQKGVKILLDIRLNNVSQLAGFTKGKDLSYFVRTILDGQYHHLIDFAPTKELLKKYQADEDWQSYEKSFLRFWKSEMQRLRSIRHSSKGLRFCCAVKRRRKNATAGLLLNICRKRFWQIIQ